MPDMKSCFAWVRRIVGGLVLAGFVVLFLGLEWRFVSWLAPIAKVQFMPALLAVNIAVAAAILAVAMLMGRLYCSVLCPLGILQDVAGRAGRIVRKIFRRPPRSSRTRSW